MELLGDPADTDIRSLDQNYVSVTPIWFDLTHFKEIDNLRREWGDDVTRGP
jgi:broad specificity polyphosphatase/5'/3'-nucleotidase SurE